MQTLKNTPWAIKKISPWVRGILPEHRKNSGILNSTEAEKINLTQILPITIMVSLTMGFMIGSVSLALNGISEVSLIIAGILSISILVIVILTTFMSPVTKIPLGWAGVVTFLGDPIYIILTPGEYKFWMPKKFIGKSLLEVIIVPTINETKDIKPSTTEPPTTSDMVALRGEITYTYEALDLVAVAPYIRKVSIYDEEGAEKALEGIKGRMDDFIRATTLKALQRLTYEQIVGSKVGGATLNNVYWEELRDARKAWRICRHKGNDIPATTLTNLHDPDSQLGYEIKEGDVIVMQGGRIKPMRDIKDRQFWEASFIMHGEHVFLPEWGVIINDSWVQGFISIDPLVHQAFMSQLMKTQEGLGAIASAKAYQESLVEVSGHKNITTLRKDKEAHQQAISEVQVLTGKKTVTESTSTLGLTKETLSTLDKFALAIGKKFLS